MPITLNPTASVVVIGAGPAGLMAAEVLSRAGIKVDVYDAMPSAGRKFLMAGKGGLNITHSEPYQQFIAHYGASTAQLQPMLERFPPAVMVDWVQGLGIKTFVGSSGRVFPKEMKAAPLLRAWLHRLRAAGVRFHMHHRWVGWQPANNLMLSFDTPQGIKDIAATGVILALGGASWPQLGSNGAWQPLLTEYDIAFNPFKPSNCGFDVNWSKIFRTRFAGQPLKSVAITFNNQTLKGDCVITESGLEGGLIYALSARLRDEIYHNGTALLQMDLAPNIPLPALIARVSLPRGKQSLTNHLRKTAHLDALKQGLLREVLTTETTNNPDTLSAAIKALPIKLLAPRPISEAISSAGGVSFQELDQHLMLKKIPGAFCAGEMLDWEAPTGGYLLTACFASGVIAAEGMINWLNSISNDHPLQTVNH
jgi:uncharacterized flavoprotein (TIGR03862 family)